MIPTEKTTRKRRVVPGLLLFVTGLMSMSLPRMVASFRPGSNSNNKKNLLEWTRNLRKKYVEEERRRIRFLRKEIEQEMSNRLWERQQRIYYPSYGEGESSSNRPTIVQTSDDNTKDFFMDINGAGSKSSSSPRKDGSDDSGDDNKKAESNKSNKDGNNIRRFFQSFAVPADEMEKDLTKEERTTVRVVRQAGPSVAYVTSIWPFPIDNDDADITSRSSPSPSSSEPQQLLEQKGVALGSGSAFVVDEKGYLVTNFHVIERAYQIQKMKHQFQAALDQIAGNVTLQLDWMLGGGGGNSNSNSNNNILNATQLLQWVLPRSVQQALSRPEPVVYIRALNGGVSSQATMKNYRQCRIVKVQPDLDLAVLQLLPNDDDEGEVFPAMTFGSSSNLLVGQGLIAIGNPFGLDNSVTTGVVSALNRELRAGSGGGSNFFLADPSQQQPIRNCIQTDCAINPGNSGGPLLNYKGQVVGVNTAIVSTTGSFAGIGFAVPSDAVAPVVQRIIQNDKLNPPQSGTSSSAASENEVSTEPTSSSKGSTVSRSNVLPYLGVQVVSIESAPRSSSATRRVVLEDVGRRRSRRFSELQDDGDDDVKNNDVDGLLERLESSCPLIQDGGRKNWILRVAPHSPADQAGIRGIEFKKNRASIVYGDAIVAVGGNAVPDFAALQEELEQRKVGEQITVTLEDGETGDRRVVYLFLTEPPE
mmetsp:Transcript_8941/g.24782  ORF Transcript_8941/g.24782 Transcript_8941/m.24782 type:complete len:702 (+) Transcript_8941:269-2374(+)